MACNPKYNALNNLTPGSKNGIERADRVLEALKSEAETLGFGEIEVRLIVHKGEITAGLVTTLTKKI
ncbi:MAG: hypothetical protein KOO60_07375 [Gemmatimonadales bacterium]|nr:hypothetical protein [Gemmatimonadales bacterium]